MPSTADETAVVTSWLMNDEAPGPPLCCGWNDRPSLPNPTMRLLEEE
jgi:hypothetical protein